jgi:hypothetical protein
LVNFLLLIEKIIDYNKVVIDKGQTPKIIYDLCSCIRESFCLSYSIRKNNTLYLFFQKEHVLIKFEGKKLRYLGPDERSQALLLIKAINKTKEENSDKNNRWLKSTPGIFIRKFFEFSSFIEFYKSIVIGKSFFLIDNPQFVEKIGEYLNLNQINFEFSDFDFFIIPVYKITRKNSNLIERFKEVKNIYPLSLSKIKVVEDKILYLNFLKDHQKTQQKLN